MPDPPDWRILGQERGSDELARSLSGEYHDRREKARAQTTFTPGTLINLLISGEASASSAISRRPR